MDALVEIDGGSLRKAQMLYGARRRRDAACPIKGLFGEPGWDILLDLFIAREKRTPLQVSSVCAGASISSTTILRWIARLEREGLILREDDRDDARRRYVTLTKQGLVVANSLLGAIGATD